MRLSRSEKKQHTTAQLLETAKTVFMERGYHRSRLDDIAEAAALTTGAVYSRYQSKDQLLLALLDQRREEVVRETAVDFSAYKTFDGFMRAQGRRLMELRRDNVKWYLLLLEFWTYSAADPDLTREFAARHNAMLEVIASMLSRAAAHFGVKLKLRPMEMARAGSAMAFGYTLERLADPVGVPDTLLESMLALLATEAIAKPRAARAAKKAARPRNSTRSRRRRVDGSTRHTARANR